MNKRYLKIRLSQLNLFVGNFEYNFKKIKEAILKGREERVDIIAFPELSITGYPPEDLLYKKVFIKDNIKYLNKIKRYCKDIICIVGFVNKIKSDIFNSAAVIYNNSIVAIYNKINLPNYSVFDERRYFKEGKSIPLFYLGNIRFGLSICEDIWVANPPLIEEKRYGDIDFLININASPYYQNKYKERLKLLKKLAKKNNLTIAYLNMVGGQDEIVFDGNSMVVNEKGKLIANGYSFKEDNVDFYIEEKRDKNPIKRIKSIKFFNIPYNFKNFNIEKEKYILRDIDKEEKEVYNALVLGTRDYIWKNGFKKVLIGLSGGIDSALTTLVAVDAIGSDNVITIFMPSQFSSNESYIDAKKLAKNVNVEFHILTIKEIYKKYLKILEPLFSGKPFNIAEENIQARIRGNLLMAISNKFGYLVLTTGNKSEMSTGYSTLYGDMAGGFAVIKDVYKSMVYKLAKYRNKVAGYDIIPENILIKEPTAELRENQKDSDSLPPYEILDKILYYYIEKHLSYKDIVKKGFREDEVKRAIYLVDRNEYKRRQAPPGVKITKLALGKDRRFPITNGYKI